MSKDEARTAIETYLFDVMKMSKELIRHHGDLVSELSLFVARGRMSVHNAAAYVVEISDEAQT